MSRWLILREFLFRFCKIVVGILYNLGLESIGCFILEWEFRFVVVRSLSIDFYFCLVFF